MTPSVPPLRHSAAVLLTRLRPDGEREVLLVRRAPALAFFGGYWACPGGVVDPCDRAQPDGEPALADLARCARRELFEETGILLGGGVAAEERARLRDALERGEAAEWGTRAPARPLAGVFELAAHVTTPPFARVRYRTAFLHAELPREEEPAARALDLSGELDGARWVRPADAVGAWLAGELLVVPPVLYLLRALAEHPLALALAASRRTAEAVDAGRPHDVRHTPGVFTLPLRTPTIPPATTTNCYVVGEDALFVIDPATWEDGERERLFALLDELRAQGRRIAGVVATHHHPDHVGSVDAVSRRYAAPVLGHPLTLARLPEPPRDARALEDEDELALGRAPDGSPGWRLRALHTPGHDRGHLAFVESRYGAAVAGDLVSTLSTIVVDPPEGHMATYLASLARLAREASGVLYPAHGTAARDARAAVAAVLEHRRAREERLARALDEGARTEEELLARVYDDVADALRPLAARSLAAGLEKLAEDGRARRRAGVWEPVRLDKPNGRP